MRLKAKQGARALAGAILLLLLMGTILRWPGRRPVMTVEFLGFGMSETSFGPVSASVFKVSNLTESPIFVEGGHFQGVGASREMGMLPSTIANVEIPAMGSVVVKSRMPMKDGRWVLIVKRRGSGAATARNWYAWALRNTRKVQMPVNLRYLILVKLASLLNVMHTENSGPFDGDPLAGPAVR